MEVGRRDAESSSASFGRRTFGDVMLGDARRTARLIQSVDRMCRHPGGTLPDKLGDPAGLQAFYDLMDRKEATHETLMGGCRRATRRAIEQAATTVLIVHDATELDYSSIKALQPRLGQLGQGTTHGYVCHNSLAVRADDGAVLGLANQILHRRPQAPKNETEAQRRERGDRESRLWIKAAEAIGPAPAGARCVDVSDRLSDTFEYMAFEVTSDRHFVLRACEDRKLAEPTNEHVYFFAAARSLRATGVRTADVAARNGQPTRKASLTVAHGRVLIAPPRKRSGEYAAAPLELWVVRVWEPEPPAGVEPVEWILLTNVAVANDRDAQERIGWYERRWIVEEYHKAMKTGCRIESMQFESTDRLEPAIAAVSATATTLLSLRDAARRPDADVRPATDVIDAEYVEVLTAHYGKRLGEHPTILRFCLFVARLGGHQNRKRDGLPGWLTLWRGWTKLQSMVDGYRAAQRRSKKCA